MKHRINPLEDPVFKALFASKNNQNLLIHFLTAVLSPEAKVVDVTLLDSHNLRSRLNDKLTIVDVKAVDQLGRSFQIEVQLATHPLLSNRMQFTWCELVTRQLKDGDSYVKLKPAIAIWIMGDKVFKQNNTFHHYFTMTDCKKRVQLDGKSGIHVFELPKWAGEVDNELNRWLRFFRDGETLDPDALPSYMNTSEMRQAMSTVRQFSEEEKQYEAYRHALSEQRYENTLIDLREIAKKELGAAQEELEVTQEKLGITQEKLGDTQEKLGAAKVEVEAAKEEVNIEKQRAANAEGRASTAELEAKIETRRRIKLENELSELRQLLHNKSGNTQ